VREPKKRYKLRNAINCFSVNTVEEAMDLMIFHAKLSKDNQRWIWPYFAGTIDAIDNVTRALAHTYARKQPDYCPRCGRNVREGICSNCGIESTESEEHAWNESVRP
jgi:ribosomal protein L37E